MDIDDTVSTPTAPPAPTLNIQRTLGPNVPSTTKVSDVMANFRPMKLFKREDVKDTKSKPSVISIDFDDPGELCITSESDETLMIYNVKEGRHDKKLLSQKYGVKLAKFTHHSSSILYASTKENDAIRYLSTHNTSFIRYFEGHTASVTSISLHPGADNFISCGRDDAVHLWALNVKNWVGKLNITTPFLSAWDPSGNVFGIASPWSFTILLYDYKNYAKGPISEFDLVDKMPSPRAADNLATGWTTLAFSNDGKNILLGTRGNAHYLFDAFTGDLKAILRKPEGGTRRAAAGEARNETGRRLDSSGDCCFAPDGRYVLSGSRKDVLVWDTLGSPAGDDKVLEPAYVLEEKREAAVLAFNPRFNMFASADQELMFWLPDPHA
ncbi:WD40 repeat-like protein [Coniochaeta ligniaria NRRL 30616]|uniref:WD40 repeat-like protein n=1 Tax=Coniochaeta ligniaria NRRL 30616 TaxID=1408157 RepID=A0A1J7K0Q3_9PEZI|nr:WD40 repeat-like protein [Coniochaeta ligniaria NRRL 30616]